MFDKKTKTKTRRSLRYRSTDPELRFWFQVRNRKFLNLKFRRQHSIGPFVVDFFCAEKNIVVEIDGDSHATKHEVVKDKVRTNHLKSLGLRIIRYNNREVVENIEGVFEHLRRVILNLPSPNLSLKGRGTR